MRGKANIGLTLTRWFHAFAGTTIEFLLKWFLWPAIDAVYNRPFITSWVALMRASLSLSVPIEIRT